MTDGIEMLVNGGFETGSLLPWIRSDPNAACVNRTARAIVTSVAANVRTGSYGLQDGTIGCYDQVAQSFSAIKGHKYVISFWLKSTSITSSGLYADFSII